MNKKDNQSQSVDNMVGINQLRPKSNLDQMESLGKEEVIVLDEEEATASESNEESELFLKAQQEQANYVQEDAAPSNQTTTDSEEDESSKSVPSNDDSSNNQSALELAFRLTDLVASSGGDKKEVSTSPDDPYSTFNILDNENGHKKKHKVLKKIKHNVKTFPSTEHHHVKESLDQTDKENWAPSSNEAMDTKKTSTRAGDGELAPLLVNNRPSDTNKGVSVNAVVIGTTIGTDTISNVDSPLTMTEAPSNKAVTTLSHVMDESPSSSFTNRDSLGTSFTVGEGNGSSKPQDAASKDGNQKVGTATELLQGLNSTSSSSSAAAGPNQGGGSGVDSFASLLLLPSAANKAANSTNKNEEGEETTAIDSTPPLGNGDGNIYQPSTVNRDDTAAQSSHKKKDGAASPPAKNDELFIGLSSQLASNQNRDSEVELTFTSSPVSVASKKADTPVIMKGNEEGGATDGFMNALPLSTGSNGSSMEEDATRETSRDLDEGDGMLGTTRCLGTSCCIIL